MEANKRLFSILNPIHKSTPFFSLCKQVLRSAQRGTSVTGRTAVSDSNQKVAEESPKCFRCSCCNGGSMAFAKAVSFCVSLSAEAIMISLNCWTDVSACSLPTPTWGYTAPKSRLYDNLFRPKPKPIIVLCGVHLLQKLEGLVKYTTWNKIENAKTMVVHFLMAGAEFVRLKFWLGEVRGAPVLVNFCD